MSTVPWVVSSQQLHHSRVFVATGHPSCRATGTSRLRVARFVSLLSIILLLLAACTPPSIPDGDTVYVLGNHGVDPVGHNQLVSIAAVRAADGHLRWRTVVPRDYWDGSALFAAAGGRLFIPIDGPLSRPGEGPLPTGSLLALGASDGRQLWRTEIGALASAPVVAGETVYIGAQQASPRSSYIYALDIATGRVKWHVALPHMPPAARISDLVFSESTLYAQAQQFCLDGCADPVAYLVALHATDGAMVWENTIPATVTPLTLVDGRLVTIGIGDAPISVVDTLYAYDAATGKQAWRVSTSALTQHTPPLVADHAVVVQEADTLAAIDSRSGLSRWSTSVPVGNVIGMDTTTIYVGGVASAALAAVSRLTGNQLWRADLPVQPSQRAYATALGLGLLYFTSTTLTNATARERWTIYAIGADNGKRRWQVDVPLAEASSPPQSRALLLAASDDALYVVGRGDHFVTARQAGDGALKWTYTSTDTVMSAFVP